MTVCAEYHELLTRFADPEDGLTVEDVDYVLALGEDDSTTPSYSDTSLNSQVTRTDVTDFINQGTDLYTSTFVDSTEANPSDGSAYQSIVEIAVIAVVDSENTEYFCNHELIAEIQKTNSKTATVECTLELNNDPNDA